MKRINLKRRTFLIASVMAVAPLVACSSSASRSSTTASGSGSASGPRTVLDQGGHQVQLPSNITRIAVTPLPWASVIWAVDGNSDRLVAMNPRSKQIYERSFLKNLDTKFGDINTSVINADFSVNVEQLLKLKPDIAFLWNDQDSVRKQLLDVGITPIMLNYALNIDSLTKDVKLVGDVLGKSSRAQKFIDTLKSSEKTPASSSTASPTKTLYLRDPHLKVAAKQNVNTQLILDGGGQNVASGVKGQWTTVSMEQIIAWDPQVIFLSEFDTFTPQEIYNNKLPGQDWSKINAVQNHRVYKTPIGIYTWDAPGLETGLMQQWTAEKVTLNSTSTDSQNQTKQLYKSFFGRLLTNADLNQIFRKSEND